MAPIIVVNLVYTVIDSITDGSNKLMTTINNTAFSKMKYSLASLEAWLFFIILLIIIGIVFLVSHLLTRASEKR